MPRAGLRPTTPASERGPRGDRMAGWTETRTTSPTRRAVRSPCRRIPPSRRRRASRGSPPSRRSRAPSCSWRSRAPRSRSRSRRSGRSWRWRPCSTRAGRGVAPGGWAPPIAPSASPPSGSRSPCATITSAPRRGVGSRRRGASSSMRCRSTGATAASGTSCSVAAPCASTLRIDGTPVDALDREVLDAAARLDDAPVLAPAELGIGVVGPSQLARSFARALIVQVANRCRPGAVEIAVPPGDAWSWAANLPHRHGGAALLVLEAGSGPVGARGEPFRDAATIAVADGVDRLPPGLETVVEVESPARAHVERRSEGSVRRTIVPELLTATEAGSVGVGRERGGDPRGRRNARRAARPRGARVARPAGDAGRLPCDPAGRRRRDRRGRARARPRGPRTARDRRRHHRQRQERVPPGVAHGDGAVPSARPGVVPPGRLQGRRGVRADPRPAPRHGHRDRPRRGRGGARDAEPAVGAAAPGVGARRGRGARRRAASAPGGAGPPRPGRRRVPGHDRALPRARRRRRRHRGARAFARRAPRARVAAAQRRRAGAGLGELRDPGLAAGDAAGRQPRGGRLRRRGGHRTRDARPRRRRPRRRSSGPVPVRVGGAGRRSRASSARRRRSRVPVAPGWVACPIGSRPPTSTSGRARVRSRRARSSSGWPTSPSASVTSVPSGRPPPTGTCSSSAVPGADAPR